MAIQDITITLKAENLVQQAIDEAIKAFKDLGNTSQLVADRLGNAFKTLDIRSAFDISADKARIVAAYDQIKTSGVASAMEIARARDALKDKLTALDAEERRHHQTLQQTGETAEKTGAKMGGLFEGIGGGALKFSAITYAVREAWQILNQAVAPAMALEQLEVKLKSATGSADGAKVAWTYLQDESKRLGLDLLTTADAFAKIAIATKNTSMEGQAARDMFTGFSEAFAALRLTTDQTNSAMLQISQGINKGKLELEDLKIIAENGIPVFELLAAALGKSRPEIMKMISDGQLLANEVYPKLAEEMHKTYGQAAVEGAKSAQAALNNVKTEFLLTAGVLGKDLLPEFATLLKGMSELLGFAKFMVDGIKVVTSGLIGLGFAAVETGKLLLGGMFSAEGRAAFVTNMKGILDTFQGSLDNMVGGQKKYYATADQLAADKAKADAKRLEEAKAQQAAAVAANDKYLKTIADAETRTTAELTAELQKREATIKGHYEARLKSVVKGSAEETDLLRQQTVDLQKVEDERRTIRAQAALKARDEILKTTAAENESRIALIQEGIARHTLSEEKGKEQILAIRRAQLAEEVKLADQRVSVLAVAGQKGTEDYTKALQQQTAAHKALNAAMEAETRDRIEREKKLYDRQTTDLKLKLDAELIDLQAAIDRGVVTTGDGNRRKLQLEEEYFDKLLSLRRARLAEMNPETQTAEYQQALAAKLDAERQHNAAVAALQKQAAAEQSAAIKQGVQDRKDGLNQEQVLIGDFNAWFKAQWKTAVDAGATALKNLSDAVYNIFAKMYDLPQQVAETADSLMAASRKAAQEARDYWDQAHAMNLRYGGSLADVFDRLAKITVTQKELTAQYYEQKSAALTLLDALQQPVNLTKNFVSYAADALANMKLLDQATLDKLRAEIDKIKGAMQQFTDQAVGALKALKDEWNQLFLSPRQQEDLRYQTQKIDLEKQYQQAVNQGNTDAMKALDDSRKLAQQIHDKKMSNLADESDAAARVNQLTGGMPMKKYAWGGKLPGGDSSFDTVPVLARPGEWFIRNESAKFWGDGVMQAINEPFSRLGTALRGIIQGFASGGKVENLDSWLIDELKKRHGKYDEALYYGNFSSPLEQYESWFYDYVSKDDLIKAMLIGGRDWPKKVYAAAIKVKSAKESIDNLGAKLKTTGLSWSEYDGYTHTLASVQAYESELKTDIQELRDLLDKYENANGTISVPKFATGGKLPGGDSAFDSIPVLARPGEWFIRNESSRFWGDGFMQAINEPFSRAGQYVASLLSGMVPQVPKFAYGGAVGGNSTSLESRVPSPGLTVNIYPQRLDESTVRREVIPVLEKYTKLKA